MRSQRPSRGLSGLRASRPGRRFAVRSEVVLDRPFQISSRFVHHALRTRLKGCTFLDALDVILRIASRFLACGRGAPRARADLSVPVAVLRVFFPPLCIHIAVPAGRRGPAQRPRLGRIAYARSETLNSIQMAMAYASGDIVELRLLLSRCADRGGREETWAPRREGVPRRPPWPSMGMTIARAPSSAPN